jgi:hypothetical protein
MLVVTEQLTVHLQCKHRLAEAIRRVCDRRVATQLEINAMTFLPHQQGDWNAAETCYLRSNGVTICVKISNTCPAIIGGYVSIDSSADLTCTVSSRWPIISRLEKVSSTACFCLLLGGIRRKI